jgi:hypothetical protein
MTEQEVVTTTAQETTTSPVFNSFEELQAWNNQQQAAPKAEPQNPEPPKNEPPTPQPTAEGGAGKGTDKPEFDIQSFLKGTFGEEFDDVEKVKSALTKKPEVDPELTPFLEDAKFLKQHPQALELARYATKEGADVPLMWSLTKMDVSKLNAKDAMVLDLVFNKGLDKNMAEAMVQRNHQIALSDGDDYDESEKLAASGELELQSREAKQRLADLQQKIRLPEPERKALEEKQVFEQREAQRVEAWKPVVKEITGAAEFAYSAKHGHGDSEVQVEFNMKLDDTQQKSYSGIVEGIVNSSQLPMNKETREHVRQLADAIFWHQNREIITKNLVSKALEAQSEALGRKFYGVPPKPQTGLPDNPGAPGQVQVHETRENAKYGKW